jgi:2-polyprenyl-3-methyl-5-hydroxy-6-metoxy-1,4-benzoquinol methylase
MNSSRDIDGYSLNYFDQPYEKFQVLFRKKKIIEFLSRYQSKNILEVGCGLESIFLDYQDFDKITILEPSSMFYSKLQEDVVSRKFNFDISTHQCFFEDFISCEHFDFIIVSSLLHEIQDLDLFLDKLYKIAQKNTIIHINVPNSESLHRLLAFESGIITQTNQLSDFNKRFQQNRVLSLKELITLVTQKNFKVLDSGSYSFKPFTHSQMSNIINSNSVDINIINNLYKLDKYLNGYGSEIFVNIIIK